MGKNMRLSKKRKKWRKKSEEKRKRDLKRATRY